jgi:hypothetical protein
MHATPQGLDMRWRLKREQVQADALFDGIYCLVANLAPG